MQMFLFQRNAEAGSHVLKYCQVFSSFGPFYSHFSYNLRCVQFYGETTVIYHAKAFHKSFLYKREQFSLWQILGDCTLLWKPHKGCGYHFLRIKSRFSLNISAVLGWWLNIFYIFFLFWHLLSFSTWIAECLGCGGKKQVYLFWVWNGEECRLIK